MKIDGLPALDAIKRLNPSTGSAKGTNKDIGRIDFRQVLTEALNNVNALQKSAAAGAQDFALGVDDNIHKVMIATEKAQLAMDMTVAVRNKVLEAYKELMRLQF